jgi:hypothetical protein
MLWWALLVLAYFDMVEKGGDGPSYRASFIYYALLSRYKKAGGTKD